MCSVATCAMPADTPPAQPFKTQTGVTMKSIFKYLLFLLATLLMAGCGSLRTGGAPDPSFDLAADLASLSKEFDSATNIPNYYSAAPAERLDARNRFISGRLVQIDLQFLKFLRTLTADKQQLDAATDIAGLTLNLAGTLVGSARAKTNLAAAAAGLGGAKTTIDKDFYYEKSIESLVATMNAKRKEALVGVLTGLGATLDQYPFERALTDLHQYYLAGTLNGAIQFINVQAAQSETNSDKKLAVLYALPIPTVAQVSDISRLTDALGAPGLTLDQARKALTTLGIAPAQMPAAMDDADGKQGALALLKKRVRDAKNLPDDKRDAAIKSLVEAFRNAGMLN